MAPGTWGSLPGIPLAIGIHELVRSQTGEQWPALFFTGLAAVCLLLVPGCLSIIRRTEAHWGTHDDKRIVIDEVLGMVLTLVWFPPTPAVLVLGFALFRLFDIWKPWPVREIDQQWPGALGTLFDDVVAGLMAAVVIALIPASWLALF